MAALLGAGSAADASGGEVPILQHPQGQSPSAVQLLKSDLDGVVLDLALPASSLETRASEGVSCQVVEVPGWGITIEEGSPQLPVYATLVGVPPGAEIALDVDSADPRVLDGWFDICPAPTYEFDPWLPGVDGETFSQPRALNEVSVRSASTYGTDAFYPAELVRQTDEGFIRHQRYIKIEVYPLQYNPTTGQLRLYEQIQVRLSFRYPQDQPASPAAVSEPAAFEQVLQAALINYEAARAWRDPQVGQGARVADPWPELIAQGEWYRIEVDRDGLYSLDYPALAEAGFPVDSLDPRTLQLYGMGREVAIRVLGEADGTFDPGDQVLFYGQKPWDSKYTRINVYWLTYGQESGQAKGLRMTIRDGSLSGMAPVPVAFDSSNRAEQNKLYIPSSEGDDEVDRWLWDFLFGFVPISKSFSITLDHVHSEPFSATLRVAFHGFVDNDIDPDHHTRLYVNDHLVQDDWWDGTIWYTNEVAFSSAYLREGINSIKVECPVDTGVGYDLLYVDWFEIDYRRLHIADNDSLTFGEDNTGEWEYHVQGFTGTDVETYDVTDPWAVAHIATTTVESEGASFTLSFEDDVSSPTLYLAQMPSERLSPLAIKKDTASSLHNPENGAAHLIVTHGDFYTDVLPLASHRQGQGLPASVVDVQDIYDEFNYGVLSPHAIHAFLSYAYENWTPPTPAYVLLVGHGTADYKDYRNTGRKTYIPPRLARVDPWVGEVDADNRYVCVSGGDTLPDMYLGRLPAVSAAEVQAMVAKILAYEQAAAPAPWQHNVAFVADNTPDQAGNFVALSEDLIDGYLPQGYVPDRVYLDDYCDVPSTNPCPAARDALVSSIDQGRLFVNYIGHAAVDRWAHESMWNSTGLSALTITETLPIMLSTTCDEGAFANPYSGLRSIGANSVRIADTGAVASWSPSGQSSAPGKQYLNKGFLRAVFRVGVRDLGAATLAGKLNAYLYSDEPFLVDTFLLFGDPALHIKALDLDLQVAKTVEPAGSLHPGDVLTYTLTFTNAGPAMAYGVVLTDLLPAELLTPTVVYSSPEVLARLPGFTYAWSLANLPPGTSGLVQVRATVDPSLQATVTLRNEAAISSRIPDTDTLNNTAAVVLTVVPSRQYFLYLPLVARNWHTYRPHPPPFP